MVALALNDDIFEQRDKSGGNGECVAIIEAAWRRTENGAESVVLVEEGGRFVRYLLANEDNVVVAMEFVLYNLPVMLDDDGSHVDKKVGVDTLTDL